jgi:hypothetical protein
VHDQNCRVQRERSARVVSVAVSGAAPEKIAEAKPAAIAAPVKPPPPPAIPPVAPPAEPAKPEVRK